PDGGRASDARAEFRRRLGLRRQDLDPLHPPRARRRRADTERRRHRNHGSRRQAPRPARSLVRKPERRQDVGRNRLRRSTCRNKKLAGAGSETGCMTKGALDGVRVLELTHAWAGPYCGMMLGDMGAEFIKTESPRQEPEARGGYPYVGKESAIFMMLHRNKKSLTLDLKSAEGKK